MQIDIERIKEKRNRKETELKHFKNIVDILESIQLDGTQELEFLKEKIKECEKFIHRYNGELEILNKVGD